VRAPREVLRLVKVIIFFAAVNLSMEPIRLLDVEFKFIESGLY
jgi:hypothetical protein